METELTPGNVLGIFEEEKVSVEELQLRLHELKHKTIREKEKIDQDKVDELQSDLFVSRFSDYVRAGIIDWLILEDGLKDDGWGHKHYYAGVFKGVIPVFKLQSRHQGPSHNKKFETPNWMKKAMEKLNLQGWECEIRANVFSDPGIGNDLLVHLCIADPRVAKTEEAIVP